LRNLGTSHVVTLLLVGLEALVLSRPGTAHAFAQPAVLCVAQRLESALPPGARSGADGDAAVASAVARQLEAQASDVERFAARHRFAVGVPLLADGVGPLADGVAAVIGSAPRELETAAVALRGAYTRRDRAAVVERLADLAIAATDLADPFQVVGLDQPEAPGARAAFSDLLVGSVPIALEAHAPGAFAHPVSAGVALAEESSGLRGAIEGALELGDTARLEELRRGRLEAALGLAGAIASQAWRAAGEPAMGTDGLDAVRIWPNPVRSAARMSFMVPGTGPATVELFDLAGRRVWSKPLGSLVAGSHTAALPVGAMGALSTGFYMVRVSGPRYAVTGRLTYQAR